MRQRIHPGLILALACAVLGYIFLFKSRIGYELRLTGQNEEFAKYSGINIVKVVLVSQLLGGFIAGMGRRSRAAQPDLYEIFLDLAAWLRLGCDHHLYAFQE